MPVRFRDTDAQGHVYFGNYFVFCDEALSAYMRAIGFPWQEMTKGGTDMYFVNANCDYLGSAKFEEDIHIETRISRMGNSSVTTEFMIRNAQGETLAKVRLTSVSVDPKTRTKVQVPEVFRAAVTAFEGELEDR